MKDIASEHGANIMDGARVRTKISRGSTQTVRVIRTGVSECSSRRSPIGMSSISVTRYSSNGGEGGHHADICPHMERTCTPLVYVSTCRGMVSHVASKVSLLSQLPAAGSAGGLSQFKDPHAL